ncbi:hypothetical protein L208DRAFT_1233758 [Tricholoma matsutake]|nr:hypothetical protein L208DRAFT_1233758 [Tricholoma matsutake 945]
MPNYILSLPAWNPSSWTPRTPLPDSPEIELASSSHQLPISPQQQRPVHPLLDSQLTGAKMKVSVTGGEHKDKEVAVTIMQVSGQLSIRFSHYKTSGFLPLEQVSPKHPHLMHDNGPLVVIDSEHCGKNVHRIHH